MLRSISKIIGLCILFVSMQTFATSEKQAQAIDSFTESFLQTFEAKDLEDLRNYYHPDAIAIGTGQDEILQGRDKIMEGYERDLHQQTSFNIKSQREAVYVNKDSAFATYILKISVQTPNSNQPYETTLRFTMGLVKYHHAWHIIQSHLSAPLAKEAAGQSYPSSNG